MAAVMRENAASSAPAKARLDKCILEEATARGTQ